MAKKKRVSKKIPIWGAVLLGFGVAMALLGLVPFIQYTTTLLSGTSTETFSAYQLLGNLFEDGFAENAANCTIQIMLIAYFVTCIMALVFGVLALLKIYKAKQVGLISYCLMFMITLIIMICVLSLSGETNISIALPYFGALADGKLGTWIYIPMGVSAVMTGLGIVRAVKK